MQRTFLALVLLGLGGAAVAVLPSASASAVPDTTPALAATGADSMSLVWRGTAPKRLHQQTSANGRWSETAEFTGAKPFSETSGVGLGADPRTGKVLAATVADDKVWVRTTPGAPWSAIGGPAVGAPAVAGVGNGAFTIVVRGDDGTLRARHLRAGQWGKWTSLGGTKFTTSPAAAVQGGRLLIAAAQKNRLVRTTTLTGGKATRWRATGVLSTATPGLATEPGTGTMHLLTREVDLTAVARTSTDGGRTWNPATRLNGRLGSGIAAASRSAGTVDIAALSLDGRVVQTTFRRGKWEEFRTVLATRTTVLPEEAVTAVQGDTITLAPDVTMPKPGEILATGVGPATPNGFLVKVTTVSGRTVKAVPAKLTEAIPEATINETFTLSTAEGPIVKEIKKNVTCDNTAGADITGTVSITPTFDLNAHWSTAAGVDAVSFTGTLVEDIQLRSSISGTASCTLKQAPLLDKPMRFKPIVFAIGPVPVVITPAMQLYLDASGSVQAALTTFAGQKAAVTAGLAYGNGSVGPVSGLNNSYTYQQPTVSRQANAVAGVAPAFTFLIYGLPGPSVTTRAHLRLEADTAQNPPWTLKAGVSAGVGLVVPQLDMNQTSNDVVRYDQVLATGSVTASSGF